LGPDCQQNSSAQSHFDHHNHYNDILADTQCMGGGNVFKVGNVITYTLYEGLNFTILVKITPLWKRIGEPLKYK